MIAYGRIIPIFAEIPKHFCYTSSNVKKTARFELSSLLGIQRYIKVLDLVEIEAAQAAESYPPFEYRALYT